MDHCLFKYSEDFVYIVKHNEEVVGYALSIDHAREIAADVAGGVLDEGLFSSSRWLEWNDMNDELHIKGYGSDLLFPNLNLWKKSFEIISIVRVQRIVR